MLNLGSFNKDDKTGKISGVLYGVSMVPTKLIFEPMNSERGTPYYKIFAQAEGATAEAGAAWPKVAKNEGAKPYMDVKLISPALAAPLYGKLFESDVVPGQHNLLWEEPAQQRAPAPRQVTGMMP